jgi:hypothetical protein
LGPVAYVGRAAVSNVLPFPIESVLCCHSAAPCSGKLGSNRPQLWPQRLIPSWWLPSTLLFGSEYTLLGMLFRKGHQRCCASGPDGTWMWCCILGGTDPMGCLSLQILETHQPG